MGFVELVEFGGTVKIEGFEDIKAWQEARTLVRMVYEAARANTAISSNYKFREQIQSAAASSRHSKNSRGKRRSQ